MTSASSNTALSRLKWRIRLALRRKAMPWLRLGSPRPVSGSFGFDRGTPVDRLYIDRFLAAHADAIKGRTLEVGDDFYTSKFGSAVIQADVLHVHDGNLRADFVGDLTEETTLPENAFDCLVITQTIHLIYDMPASIRTLYRSLRPGGIILATVPGISQIAADEWGSTWCWSLTPYSASRLFADAFGEPNVVVTTYGNVYAASAFLQGLCCEEVPTTRLDPFDPSYPVIIGVVATKNPAPTLQGS